MERQEFSVVVTNTQKRLQTIIKVRSVEDSNGCWNWPGSLSHGYGQLQYGGVKVCTHIFSYKTFVGPIPKGLCVLHHCDNRRCVNPKHLFLGTKCDNTHDGVRKGRILAKLTADDVREIRILRKSGMTFRALAKKFGVHDTIILKVCNRIDWAHID